MPQVYHGHRHLAAMVGAFFSGARRRGPVARSPGFSRSPNPPSARPYSTASEARLATCRRMSSKALWRRMLRNTWSTTSRAAATRALQERAKA